MSAIRWNRLIPLALVPVLFCLLLVAFEQLSCKNAYYSSGDNAAAVYECSESDHIVKAYIGLPTS